jgi:hypothetical protein
VLADASSASRTLSSSDRALCHQAGDVSMHRRISPALPAIRVAFAPGVPVVNSHVRLLHLHFLHFITPTRQAPCQSLLHHTLLALTITAPASFEVHGVAQTFGELLQSVLRPKLFYLQTASTHCPQHTQHKQNDHVIFSNTSFFFVLFVFFFKHSQHVWDFGLRFRRWRT